MVSICEHMSLSNEAVHREAKPGFCMNLKTLNCCSSMCFGRKNTFKTDDRRRYLSLWPSDCQEEHATTMQIRWIFIQADGERATFRGNLSCVCVQLSVCPQEKVVLQRRSESCGPRPHFIFTISCQEELAMGVFHYSLNQKHSGQSESVWPVKLLHRSLPELLPSF